MEIPKELIDSFIKGKVVLFIGNGLSIGSGLPGWSKLIFDILDEEDIPEEYQKDLLDIAQYIENTKGRHYLIDSISEKLSTAGKKPNKNHEILLEFGSSEWVTTNYDDLIEKQFDKNDIKYHKIVSDSDLAYGSSKETKIMKIHGDLNQKDSIVITQNDYLLLFKKNPRIKEKISSLLIENTVLFLGYGINDPDFNQLNTEIAFDLETHKRKAYAVFNNIDEFKMNLLQSNNIEVINLKCPKKTNKTNFLNKFLRSLLKEIVSKKSSIEVIEEETKVKGIQLIFEEHSNVEDLLKAMGYKILDREPVGDDCYFLCNIRGGAEVNYEVIHYVSGRPSASDISALSDSVISHDSDKGILLTKSVLPEKLMRFINEREKIKTYTISDFITKLADFTEYLQNFVKNFENSEIPNYFIPIKAFHRLDIKGKMPISTDVEEYIDKWLLDEKLNHLSILGEFGSGKTWFCNYYTYKIAKEFLETGKGRIPVLINLRDYYKTYDVEQLVTDAIVNKYKIPLAGGYLTFNTLNKSGSLLIIFDGFDEMERIVSNYKTTVDNFWELAKIVLLNSKVILTCRTEYFRHKKEEETTFAPEDKAIQVTSGDKIIDLSGKAHFDVIYIQDFSDEDIKLALQKRLPDDWETTYEKVHELANLRDLAKRPVLLNMIVKTLPNIKDPNSINKATLYKNYTDTLMDRRFDELVDFLSKEQRMFFVQELAWEMYLTQKLTIPFSEFPQRVIDFLEIKDDPEQIAFAERDLRTQSYLIRDDDGNYRFAHKSFQEYFIALKIANTIESTKFDLENAIKIWKQNLFTLEIKDFLFYLITNTENLWEIINYSKSKKFTEIYYSASNAFAILKSKNESFVNKDLSHTILVAADMFNLDLSNTNLSHADLSEANLSGSTLTNSNFQNANLSGVKINEMGGINFLKWSHTGKFLSTVSGDGTIRVWITKNWNLYCEPIDEIKSPRNICWHPNDDILLTNDLSHEIIFWSLKEKKQLFKERFLGDDNYYLRITRRSIAYDKVFSTRFHHPVHEFCFNNEGNLIARISVFGTISICKYPSGDLVKHLDTMYGRVIRLTFSKDNMLLIGSVSDGKILFWDVDTWDLIRVIPEFNKANYSKIININETGNIAIITVILIDGTSKIILLDLSTQSVIRAINIDSYNIESLCICPKMKYFAYVNNKNNIILMNVSDFQIIKEIETDQATVNVLEFSPNGLFLASGNQEGIISIWKIDPEKDVFGVKAHSIEVKMDCSGMKIKDAIGLNQQAPDGSKSLEDWLILRGAIKE